jgi:NAD(P)-dependent dehydrogenase (short-subunit alcohol dehydrogenase family)
MSRAKWTAADLPSQAGRTFVVTGANSGIGLITARELARAGARVVLAVRDRGRGEQAAATVPGGAEVRVLDLADLGSVRAFAEAWDEDLDVLVNNAGVMAVPPRRTVDGFELQLGTNHLGHFALTNLLLPHLRDRVVTVSSGAHRMGRIDLEDLNWERRGYQRWGAYGQSKLANLLFTLELQRRLAEAGSPLRGLAAHPGYAATNLQSRTENPVQHAVMAVLNRVVAQSDEMGALPTLFAATQDLPGAAYVGPDGLGEQRGHPTLVGRSAAASAPATARALWERSEALTGVTFPLAPGPRGHGAGDAAPV